MTDTKRIVESETWDASGHLVCTVEPPSPKNGSTGRQILAADDMCGPTDYADHTDEARATVAACAPEALRLLMRAEWASLGRHDTELCPWCRGDGHTVDCEFVALMKKAGLR